MRKIAALKVDCPRCSQPTGKQCLKLTCIPHIRFRAPHAERKALARQLALEESAGSTLWCTRPVIETYEELVADLERQAEQTRFDKGAAQRREREITRARMKRAFGRAA